MSATAPLATLTRENGPGPSALLWLIATMTLATLPFVTALPPWQPPVLAAIAWWRWRRERRGLPPPSTLARVAVSGLVVAGLALSGRIGLGIEAAVPLFVAFLWIKLLELRGERDVLMGCYLSCFLASASLLTDQGVLRTLYALGALVATFAAALRFQLGRGAPAPPSRTVLRMGATMVAQGLPAAALLFLLLPRPVMNLPVEHGRGTSGLSDRMKPGEIASIALNQDPAFRVAFADGPPGDPEALYWRGLVLTEAEASGWFRGIGANLRGDQRPRLPRGVRDDPLVEHEITLLPHMRHWLYALDCPVGWPSGVFEVSGRVLMVDQAVQSPVTYPIRSRPGRSPVDMDAAYRRRTLATPAEVDPGVRELATALRARAEAAGDGSAAGISAATLAWFGEQGFVYTLEPGAIDGDLVAGFLARKAGFCGHYSAAYALLMRLAGIPARVVIGYRGGEWNEPGGFLIVRQAHAHAWTEIWIEDEHRWQRVDPTAAVTGNDTRRIASEGAQAVAGAGGLGGWPFWRRGRQWWDWVNATWETWMFRFDAEAQQRLRDRLGLGRLGRLGETAVALALALAAIMALALLLRRRRPRRDPARVQYDRWCRRLASAGCARAPDEGPQAYAARATAALPGMAAEIAAVTAAYVAARYAAADAGALERLRAAVRTAGGGPARG